jgi:hypothetical protein
MSAWPSKSCKSRMPVPLSSRCVAKLCRSVCGVTRLSNFARAAASRIACWNRSSSM